MATPSSKMQIHMWYTLFLDTNRDVQFSGQFASRITHCVLVFLFRRDIKYMSTLYCTICRYNHTVSSYSHYGGNL